MKLSRTELKLIEECHENGSAHFFTRGDQNKRKYEAVNSLRDRGIVKYSIDRCEVQQVSAYGRTRLQGFYRHYLCFEVRLLAGRVEANDTRPSTRNQHGKQNQ